MCIANIKMSHSLPTYRHQNHKHTANGQTLITNIQISVSTNVDPHTYKTTEQISIIHTYLYNSVTFHIGYSQVSPEV